MAPKPPDHTPPGARPPDTHPDTPPPDAAEQGQVPAPVSGAHPTAPVSGANPATHVSQNLRDAARALSKQDGSRRALFATLGVKPRLRDRVFSWVFRLLFPVFFLLPFGLGVVYLTSYLSKQYESEARFVLRSALPVLLGTEGDTDANAPDLKIVQDIQVLASYLDSSQFVALLDARLPLDEIYGRADIDWWSRLPPDTSLIEKTDYLRDFISTTISPSSGIVTVTFRAFSVEEAHWLLSQSLELAEAKVNALNADIWRTVLAAADQEFQAAAGQLQSIRTQYQQLQNETGVFDIDLEAEAIADVLADLRKEQIVLESERDTLLRTVSDTHPNVVKLRHRIEARRTQIAQLETQVASARSGAASLADNQQRFEALNVQTEIAQARFKRAAAELEQTKFLSSIQMLYVDRFMGPTLPDDFAYPKILLGLAQIFLIAFAIWSATGVALASLRRWLD